MYGDVEEEEGEISLLLPLMSKTGVSRAFCKGVECLEDGKLSIIKVVGGHDPGPIRWSGIIFKF